jgi:hypothetical protein
LLTTRRIAVAIAMVMSPFIIAIVAGCADPAGRTTGKGSGDPAVSRFVDSAPGTSLPSGQRCAQLVTSAGATAERHPENDEANHRRAVPGHEYDLPRWNRESFGMDPAAESFGDRIDGAFEGTTDQIIRWGACKWGFDEDVVRAVAQTESSWRQSVEGDKGADGNFLSFGLLQVKKSAHSGTFPATQLSTAFNVDYALGYRRACYEGYLLWLARTAPNYRAGDAWGCVGHWFSGEWHDGPGDAYIGRVRSNLRDRLWER